MGGGGAAAVHASNLKRKRDELIAMNDVSSYQDQAAIASRLVYRDQENAVQIYMP